MGVMSSWELKCSTALVICTALRSIRQGIREHSNYLCARMQMARGQIAQGTTALLTTVQFQHRSRRGDPGEEQALRKNLNEGNRLNLRSGGQHIL